MDYIWEICYNIGVSPDMIFYGSLSVACVFIFFGVVDEAYLNNPRRLKLLTDCKKKRTLEKIYATRVENSINRRIARDKRKESLEFIMNKKFPNTIEFINLFKECWSLPKSKKKYIYI